MKEISNQLAAIYIFDKSKQNVTISQQIDAIKRFLDNAGMTFSGDLFIERADTGYINCLARSRAWSKRFDKIICYVTSNQDRQDKQSIGIIACLDAQTYAYSKATFSHSGER